MSSRNARPSRAMIFPLACLLLVGIAVLIYAAPPQQSAPPAQFSSQNEFFAGGLPFNGDVVLINTASRSGVSPEGFIGRAHRTDERAGLGNFEAVFNMTERRQGAGAVLARGPIPGETRGAMPAPHDSTSYLYIVGGITPNGVSDTIERAYIDAGGAIHPGVESDAAGFLIHARYGAAVVARGDFIYVIGGYDALNQPLNSIERIPIGGTGHLGASVELAGPGWGGDVASVIVNGYLYVIGGNTLSRGPDEGAIAAVARATVDPRGDLGPFEDLGEDDAWLPVGTAGGRAFAVMAWDEGAPFWWIYYAGGNVGNTQTGATGNVYRLGVSLANMVSGPWSSVPDGTGLVSLVEPRQLFASVVTNGYVYAIGGETTSMGHTTFYSTVERAAIGEDGSIGPFIRLDQPRETYINDLERASDIQGIAFNNTIYVPGGRNSTGGTMDAIFRLNMDQPGALLPSTAPDAALFGAIHDMGMDAGIDSLTFDLDPDPALPGGILFRFRLAGDGGDWGAWSGYVTLDALPGARPGFGMSEAQGDRRLLDLSYPAGVATACSEGVVPNPTGFQAPLVARYLEYEIVMPEGDHNQRLNALAINGSPIVHFALPGGYDPTYGGTSHPPSCSPSHAIADGGTMGWLRFEGAGFPEPADPAYESQFRFVASPAAPAAPNVMVTAASRVDASIIDIQVGIEKGPGGLFTYDLQFDPDGPSGTAPFMTVMSPALKVHPALDMHAAPIHALDVNPANATPNENVVAAPGRGLTSDITVTINGFHFRSGRVDESGPVATDDAGSPVSWPGNPAATEDEQPSFLRYRLEDKTVAPGFVPLKVSGVAPGAWRRVEAGEIQEDTRFLITLAVDHKAKSGPHDLEITIQNPQLGSTVTVTQTLFIVPALGVTSFTTLSDPTPDPLPGQGNDYDWTGAMNPAVADLGDGVGTPQLVITVDGYGFQSDTGTPLVHTVTPMSPAYGPGAGAPLVHDSGNLQFELTVPGNTMPGRHDVALLWSYVPGVSDPYDPGTQSAPVRDPATVIERTWRPEGGSWETLFIVPPRVGVQSILGSSNTQSPIVLLQSDPTLTVNGHGFATGGPTIGFGSVLQQARLVSMVNSPDEDIVVAPAGAHMVSDCQARLTMELSAAQRPGETYQLEIRTAMPWVPVSSKIRDPYSVARSDEMVTVLPLPQCEAVSVSCFAAEQGGSMASVQILGRNFDNGTKVNFGPGVTVSNLDVCNDDPGRGCTTQDRLTFDLEVSALATPGRRSIEIENGPTSSISQRATCAAQFDLWVVPVPTLSMINPGSILQPPASVGTRRVPVEIYGTNFVTGATVEVVPPSADVTVKGPAVVVDSGHISTELEIRHTGEDQEYTLRVREPAGPTCSPALPNPTVQGSLQITGFRELGISAVANQVSQCQGRSGTLQVTGTNFRDPLGTPLVSGASLGPDVSIESMSIDGAGTTMTVLYDIGDSAALGRRALVLQPVLQGGTPAVWANALTVTSSPSLTSISPPALATGIEQVITITGRNFYEGGAAVTVEPSTDVTVTGVTVVNTGVIRATIAINAQASPIDRSITVINNDGGACSTATLTSAFRVIPSMSIAGVSNHTTSCQGRTGTLVVTGTNFRDPGGSPLVSAATLGVDVSVDSMTIDSATSLSINYSVADGAALGKRPLTLTSSVQGANPAIWPNALTITSSPVLMSVSPRSFSPGDSRQVTISGRSFLGGATLAVTPSAGVTLSGMTVVNSGQIVATVTVSPTATPGEIAMILDNQDGACSATTLNGAIQVIDPPHVTSWRFRSGTLQILGTNFHPSMQAYVGGSTVPYSWVRVTRNSKVVLSKVKPAFPRGVETTVRLVNPDDGGEITITVVR